EAAGGMKARQKIIPDWGPVLARDGRWSALVRAGSRPRLVPAGGIAFLAAPWLGEVSIKQEFRPRRAAQLELVVARELLRLMSAGVTAICPVLLQGAMTSATPLVSGNVDPLDAAAWEAWSRPLLTGCSVIVVPDVQGWDRCPTVWGQ